MRANFDIESTDNHFERYTHVRSELVFDTCPNLKPTISILIPTFKRPHLIKDAIDSAFNQKTDVTFEVVVVDNDADCEFENELKALISSYSNFNIRYYRNEENIGMFGNWNRCIELSRAEWFTILNDDDILNENFLQIAFDYLEKDCELKMVSTSPIRFGSNSELNLVKKSVKRYSLISCLKMLEGHFTNGTLGSIYNKKEAVKIGGFDECLYPTCDYHFAMKFVYNNKCALIDNNLAYMRWMENESMKINVVKLFIKNDYIMWGQVINLLSDQSIIPAWKKHWLKYRSRLLTIVKLPKYKKLLNLKSVEELENSLDFSILRVEKIFNYFYPRSIIRLNIILAYDKRELFERITGKLNFL